MKTRKRIIWMSIAWCLAAVLVGLSVGKLTKDMGYQSLHDEASDRLLASIHRVRGALNEFHYLPFLLTQNEDVIQLLNQDNPVQKPSLSTKVSRYLEQTNLVAGASGLFIVNQAGQAVAYSNWRDAQMHTANTFAQLPLFQLAQQGEEGRFFERTQTQAFYYLSAPIYKKSHFVGAAIVRIDLATLLPDSPTDELFTISDDQQTIFIASPKTWAGKQPSQIAQIHHIKLQDGASARIWNVNQHNYLTHKVRLDDLGWTFTTLVPTLPSERYANLLSAITISTLWILGCILLYLRERRLKHLSQHALEQALLDANSSLELKVEERTQALKNAQEELIQSSKMAALGRMSSAIVHELNQPLTAMRTYIAISKQVLQDPELLQQNLALLDDLTQRMATITSQLKTFAYKKPRAVIPVSLHSAITQTKILLNKRFEEEDILLDCSHVDHEHCVWGDNARIEQVLVNLVSNACDALQDSTQKVIRVRSTANEQYIDLNIEDSGSGISAELQPHLFEPFYTTKSMGSGLGLGLAIVAAIVRDLQGSITVSQSTLGGASFNIRLQAATNDSPSDVTAQE